MCSYQARKSSFCIKKLIAIFSIKKGYRNKFYLVIVKLKRSAHEKVFKQISRIKYAPPKKPASLVCGLLKLSFTGVQALLMGTVKCTPNETKKCVYVGTLVGTV